MHGSLVLSCLVWGGGGPHIAGDHPKRDTATNFRNLFRYGVGGGEGVGNTTGLDAN